LQRARVLCLADVATSTDELPTDLSGISFIDFASGNWLLA
jgi:hypothetical protein